jgi:hypothetical protein
MKRLKGNASLKTLEARTEGSVHTKEFPMLESKLAPGYIWANGGKKTSKDDLKGIWVKIYVGDKLVHQQSRPENMMRKEAW